jgi:DNA-binding NarL/FixJ family response regulator
VLTCYLADPSELFLIGLGSVIEEQGIFKVLDRKVRCPEPERDLKEFRPDLVIVNIALLREKFDAYMGRAREMPEPPWTLCLFDRVDTELVAQGIEHGIEGMIEKDRTKREFLEAVDTLMEGKGYLGPGIKQVVMNSFLRGESDAGIRAPLTPREQEVFDLILKGFIDKEIAAELGVSPNTVNVHRRNILKKYGVRNFAELILRFR